MEREGASVSALRPTLEARASSYGPEDPSRRAFQPEGPAANSHTPWTYEHALSGLNRVVQDADLVNLDGYVTADIDRWCSARSPCPKHVTAL